MNPALVALTSLASAVFMALRLHALKPENAGGAAASLGSRIWMLLLSAMALFHAQAVFFTQQATWTEGVMTLTLLGYSFHMWLNVRNRVVLPMRQGLSLRS